MSNKVNYADAVTCKVVKDTLDDYRFLRCWEGGKRLNGTQMNLGIINQDEINIKDFKVQDELQGRGLGTKMFAYLIKYCRRHLYRRVTGSISYVDQFERLKIWYERLGFIVTESTHCGMAYDICYEIVYRSDRVPCSSMQQEACS